MSTFTYTSTSAMLKLDAEIGSQLDAMIFHPGEPKGWARKKLEDRKAVRTELEQRKVAHDD